MDSHGPLVRRQVLVPAASTLANLHVVIQAAMGWHNTHMHQFRLAALTWTTCVS